MITLEKVDQVVERTGVTYAEAKEALEITKGDVIEAIVYIEKNALPFTKRASDSIHLKKEEVLKTLKELLKKGNVTKVIIEKHGKVYLEVPVNIAVSAGLISVLIGNIMIPIIAVIGTGMYIGDFRIKILKDDGSEVDVNAETEKKVLMLKGKVENVKEKVENIKEKTQEDSVIDITDRVIDEVNKEEDKKEDKKKK